MAPAVQPYVFSPSAHSHMTPYLAAVHASCITQDHMLGSFLPPLNHEKLLAWWKDRIAEVNAGTRMIILLLDESSPGSKAKGGELKGSVMLGMPFNETSPHCAFVEQLLVKPDFRRRGAARTLVETLEREARQRGKTLLRTETETQSPAEHVFKTLGYHEVGKIPAYAVSQNGDEKDQTIFYKILND